MNGVTVTLNDHVVTLNSFQGLHSTVMLNLFQHLICQAGADADGLSAVADPIRLQGHRLDKRTSGSP